MYNDMIVARGLADKIIKLVCVWLFVSMFVHLLCPPTCPPPWSPHYPNRPPPLGSFIPFKKGILLGNHLTSLVLESGHNDRVLVLYYENICQISSRGPEFRPQVKGLGIFFSCQLLLFPISLGLSSVLVWEVSIFSRQNPVP